MTTPTILPTGYLGDNTDYLKAKVERDGCLRAQYSTVTIPATTATDTVVGLVPFRKGFRLAVGATQLANADLDTSTNVTLNIGYVYKTGSSETDDPNAFATLLSAQTAGFLSFDEPTTALPWVATDDGWVVVQVEGGATTTSGAVYGQIVGCYDGLSAVN